MDEEKPPSDLESLPHQRKAWEQQDLLAHILRRYVNVHQRDGGRWPSWTVSAKGDDLDAELASINTHLAQLGWMGKLTPGEDWSITIFPTPERQFPRSKNVVVFWFLSSLTLTLAGSIWMNPSRPTEGWYHSSTLVDALLGYTLPVLGVLWVASSVQRAVAARYGVRCGHLLPVPDLTIAFYAMGLFPTSWLIWPFGVLLIPTMPRMDARPWPNRPALGYTALSVPLVMSVLGMVLFFVGLGLTPEYLASTAMPLLTDPPLFMSLIASNFIASDSLIRLAWAHPWVHAGGMLMLFAWISLLPIPTFPGGRLMIARMGLFNARSSSNQTLIFVTILFCAYVLGIFESFSLWYLVFALLFPLLLTLGSDLRIPIILNETTGLSEREHRRMGVMLFMVFLLFFPAAQPVVHDESWDAELTYTLSDSETAVLLDNGTWQARTEIQISNPSSLEQPYAIRTEWEHPDHGWQVDWDCDGEDTLSVGGEGCGAFLLPGRTAFFWLNLTWTGEDEPTLATFSYVLHINDAYVVSPAEVRPALEVMPAQQWYDVIDGSTVHRCVDLHGMLTESTYLNVSVSPSSFGWLNTSLVEMDDGTNMSASFTEVPDAVCLRGLDPLVFEPSMATLHLNNHTFAPLLPNRRPLEAHVPATGWTIQPNASLPWGAVLEEGGILMSGDASCPINATISTPARPLEGEWVWDTSIRSSGNLPLVEQDQRLTLQIASGTRVSLCKSTFSPYPEVAFDAVEGPELLVEWMNTTTRFWTTPWAIAHNGTLLHPDMGALTLTNPNQDPVPFRLAKEGSLGDDWATTWSGGSLPPGDSTLVLTPPDSPLSTMWLTYDGNTVVMHLASYQ